ncbi:MAG: glycerophosphodiester phosphodiesterase family protein [Solirubrobacteraceae bacterium]
MALLIAVSALAGSAGPARAADFSWVDARFLHQAHQGGENEVPTNTMYGLAYALAHGADMLEIDVHVSKDGVVVVGHDQTVDRTTNGTGRIQDMTLAELRQLDSAHWFVPGRSTVHGMPDEAYAMRGIRTGTKPPPPGYDADDFAIPTLREVLDAYPNVPLNVEIKGADNAEKFKVADALADLLEPTSRGDVVVASFEQAAIDRFKARAPHIPVSAGVAASIEFLLLGQELPPGTVALQLPFSFDLGSIGIKAPVLDDLPVELNLAQRWVTDRAHSRGVAVHYWQVPENEAAYRQVIGVCGDGIMTTSPKVLEAFLERSNVPRMGGQGGAAGADGCPHAPPEPAPGCRLHPAKLVVPRDGRIPVRLERSGDLRTACAGTVELRTADPIAVPGAKAKARRIAKRAAHRVRVAERRVRRAVRAARGRPRSPATTRRIRALRRKAARARRTSRRAARAAKAGPRRVVVGTARFDAPAGRMGATVDVTPTADGRRVLAAGPGIAVRTTVEGTRRVTRTLPLRTR